METELFLTRLFGLMLITAGAFFAINESRIKTIADNLHSQPALVAFTGMLNVLLGLMIVLAHNIWVLDTPVIITVIGYLILIKGLLRLFLPDINTEITNKLIQGKLPLIIGIILVILGAWLTFVGFR